MSGCNLRSLACAGTCCERGSSGGGWGGMDSEGIARRLPSGLSRRAPSYASLSPWPEWHACTRSINVKHDAWLHPSETREGSTRPAPSN